MIVPSENMHVRCMYVHVLAWGLYSLMLFVWDMQLLLASQVSSMPHTE